MNRRHDISEAGIVFLFVRIIIVSGFFAPIRRLSRTVLTLYTTHFCVRIILMIFIGFFASTRACVIPEARAAL
jgi:hypothetical protein